MRSRAADTSRARRVDSNMSIHVALIAILAGCVDAVPGARSGAIAGSVRIGDEPALVGVVVQVRDLAVAASSGAAGAFRVDGLAPDTYTVDLFAGESLVGRPRIDYTGALVEVKRDEYLGAATVRVSSEGTTEFHLSLSPIGHEFEPNPDGMFASRCGYMDMVTYAYPPELEAIIDAELDAI
jgi:hypothetical protein